MFLAVLPGRYWDAHLRMVATVNGRRVAGFPLDGFNGPAPLEVPQARAPDPNGGPPWGFAVSGNESAQGQIIDGRLVALEPQSGTFHLGPDGWGGDTPPRGREAEAATGALRSTGPVGHGPLSKVRAEGGEYSPPEVERRTLPGRTIITGRADADVAAVTIITPRDVRTLRPSGPGHVLIAVYDGQFFSGRITATVLLRNGRHVTEQIPDFTNVQAEAPARTLARQLAAEHPPPATQLAGSPRRSRQVAEGYLLLREACGRSKRGLPSSTPTRGVLPEG